MIRLLTVAPLLLALNANAQDFDGWPVDSLPTDPIPGVERSPRHADEVFALRPQLAVDKPTPIRPPPEIAAAEPISGSTYQPYDQAPASAYAEYARPAVTLLAAQGSQAGAGRQVWFDVSGDTGMEPSSTYDQLYAPRAGLVAHPVVINPPLLASASGNVVPHYASPSDYLADLPVVPVTPGIGTLQDSYGKTGIEAALAASIPANSLGSLKIDPERLMATPVAYHTEGASLQEILRSLAPSSYRLSFDVSPEILARRHRATFETPLTQALTSLEVLAGVKIQTYHQLQLMLITEHREALR